MNIAPETQIDGYKVDLYVGGGIWHVLEEP
jgi:hypothetical protein